MFELALEFTHVPRMPLKRNICIDNRNSKVCIKTEHFPSLFSNSKK